MANLSKQRRERMLDFLEKIKSKNKDDDDALIAIGEIEREISEKKYGLVWEDHTEEVDDKMLNNIPVFIEDKDRKITMNSDGYNFLIEGDNLHSLYLLEKTHKESIDVIYIDPPYNTGAKNWKYNNDYIDSEDTFRHSKWLSMMSKRLRIAKNLLKPTGAMVIAIDENELANLKLLVEDIFGSQYKVDVVSVIHNPGGIQGANFSFNNEYAMFIYPNVSGYITNERRDDFVEQPLRDWGKENSKRKGAPNCFFPIICDKKSHVIVGFGDIPDNDFHPASSNVEDGDNILIYPIDGKDIERRWRFARNSIASIRDELVVVESRGRLEVKRRKQLFPRKTVWDKSTYNANIYGTQLLMDMIDVRFDFPKSPYLVKDCIAACSHDKDDAIILDFFAGSGTTAQSVLEMNKEDGGHRKFILCTCNEINCFERLHYLHDNGYMLDYKPAKEANPDTVDSKIDEFLADNQDVYKKLFEDNYEEYQKYGICQSVTYPRVKAVISGVRQNGTKFADEMPANLKYFKTGFVSKKAEPLSEELIKHIDQMIELEYGVEIDKEKYISILTDEEADELEARWNEYPDIKAIYISRQVLLTGKQSELFNTKEVYVIPDYYFRAELREAGEA